MKAKVIFSCLALVFFAILSSCQSDEQLEFARYYSAGSLVYQTKCQNCHGKNGEGLLGLIPPLTDTTYLKKNRSKFSCLIKNGIKGKIVISKRTFEGEMRADDLPPIEIANVLTYVGNSFGNKLGTIKVQQVQDELGRCR